ncbi:MAG: 3-dehydroquinate synthase [Candidatus Dadabacteria bacterium]|nr:3-dehydroquinate synthase [Candidatus Dadabacteria bacterium]
MKKIEVKVRSNEDNSYEILIGQGLLSQIAGDLVEASIAHSHALVTDSNVADLYGAKLLSDLGEVLPEVSMIVFPAGEQSKTREIKSFIEDRMLESGFGRDSSVVALGGGVVGDIAGFVAATYMRGVPCVQVPTSLVACVDSSVGGKTAVDTPHGKNLIGSFYQPWRVYVDTDMLKTLEPKQLAEGLAEIIKYGVIRSEDFFQYLEANIEKIYEFDNATLLEVIETSCRIKAEVVEKDEKEQSLRKILNFGHTVGHAIEQLSDYTISHGEAISAGMVIEGKIALGETGWNEEEQGRLTLLLQRAGLPTEPPRGVNVGKIIDVMKIDKKARKGKIEMSLPECIGKMKEHEGDYGIRIGEQTITSAFRS